MTTSRRGKKSSRIFSDVVLVVLSVWLLCGSVYGQNDDDDTKLHQLEERVRNDIDILAELPLEDALRKVDAILSTITKELDLQNAFSKSILWEDFPGSDVIQHHIEQTFGETILAKNNRTRITIDEKMREQTGEALVVDPGIWKSGYDYCRFYFVSFKTYNKTALSVYCFTATDPNVFKKVSGLVTDTFSSMTDNVERTANWITRTAFFYGSAIAGLMLCVRMMGWG